MSRKKKKHYKGKVHLLLCRLVSCEGDENGCDGSECREPKWERWTHDDYKKTFGKCPRLCSPASMIR